MTGETSTIIQTGVVIGAFWGLLKWTVTDKLKTIAGDIHDLKLGRKEDSEKIQAHAETLAEIKERHRQEDAGLHAFGRRAHDHCTAPNCPFEQTSPGLVR